MKIETIKVDPEADRDGWLALREQDVTASVAGALLGVHPYKSRYGLWMNKAGRVSADVKENVAMIRGRRMERPALEILGEDRPRWKIEQPNVYLRAPELRIGATPDAYAVDPKRKGFGNVQVKTTTTQGFKKGWHNEHGEVEPPLWIAIQTIQEAKLAGASWACVVVLVMDLGLTLEVIDVPIHEGVFARVVSETQEFWKSIKDGVPPDPDYGADGALISAMYAEDNGREVDLTGDNMLPAILPEREAIRQRMIADKGRLAEIDAEIAHKVGDFERAIVDGWLIRRPIVSRKGFFVEPTSYRRTTIKKI